MAKLDELTPEYSAAAFASLRSQLKAKECKTIEEVVAVVEDQILPAIGQTRRYQTLQALVNCTRRSLLPDPDVTEEDRQSWQAEIRRLEALGIRGPRMRTKHWSLKWSTRLGSHFHDLVEFSFAYSLDR